MTMLDKAAQLIAHTPNQTPEQERKENEIGMWLAVALIVAGHAIPLALIYA